MTERNFISAGLKLIGFCLLVWGICSGVAAFCEVFPFITSQADIMQYVLKRSSVELSSSAIHDIAQGSRPVIFMVFGSRFVVAMVKFLLGLYLCRRGTAILNFLAAK